MSGLTLLINSFQDMRRAIKNPSVSFLIVFRSMARYSLMILGQFFMKT